MWKVVLVDDEPGVVDGLSVMVDWEHYGFSIVGTASDGAEALSMIELRRPDLVMTDIRMPELDGLDLVRETNRLPGIDPLFVIVSGHREFDYARQAVTLGVEDYLLKPLYEEDLTQTLVSLAERLPSPDGESEDPDTIRRVLSGESDPSDGLRIVMAQPFVLVFGRADDADLVRVTDPVGLREAHKRLLRFMTRVLKFGPDRGRLVSSEDTVIVLLQLSLIRDRFGALGRYLDRLVALTSSGSGTTSSFAATGPIETLPEARKWWRLGPRVAELLCLEGPRAHVSADDLIAGGACDDSRLLESDRELVHRIAEADAERAAGTVSGIGRMALARRIEPNLVLNFVRTMCFEMHRLVTELNGIPAHVEELQLLCKHQLNHLLLQTHFDLLREAAVATAQYIGTLSSVRPSARMQQVCRDLIHSFKTDVTLRELAERHGLTPAYLGQLFRKEYGESFNDYRNRLRVEEAARLLRGTEMRVYEIAEEVGYHSTDYFERRFSAFFEVTPTAYREANRKVGV